jgi:HK97 family phage portal protein
MGILTSILGQKIDRSPSSDYWYTPIGAISDSGISVTEDQVLKISAVLQGVRFLSQTVAGLPRFIFRRLEDDRSREKDTSHQLNRILRFQPNPWQTSFQFVETLTAHAMLKRFGVAQKFYNEKTGDLEALVPLDPGRMVKFEQLPNGKLRYYYRQDDGSLKPLLQDELFVISGFGMNGISGLPLIEQMKETAGLALATEKYGAYFFANSAMPRVVLTSPKVVSQHSRDRMRSDWDRSYGGGGKHGTALLEEDTKVDVLSTKNDEAQFIETRKFLIAEFSRHLDVTPHRLSDLEKSSYNNVEQMSLETVVYSLTPWVRRWEQSCYRDLLTEDDKESGRYVEFILEGLLRGDTAARAQFYQSGVNTGWLTRNEVREKENLNPIEGLDDPLQAVNQVPVGEGTTKGSAGQTNEEPDDDRAQAIARAAAERVLRREMQAVARWKERKNGNDPEWRRQVETFYQEHVNFVARSMAMDEKRSKRWCENQQGLVLEFGPDAIRESMIAFLVMEALEK